MKRIGAGYANRSAMLCVLLLALWAAAMPAHARRIALLVAIGTYAEGSGVPALGGPPNDARALRAALTQKWGFRDADIETLSESQATRANILRAIATLKDRSSPGDLVLLYFSGHGTSAADRDTQLPLPDGSGAWVPYDFRFGASKQAAVQNLIVGRTDLRPTLELLDRDRQVVVISDSCYSGNVVRAVNPLRSGRFLPASGQAAPVAAGPRPLPPPYPYRNVLMLSAASDSEVAQDISQEALDAGIKSIDGKPHGTFTDGLLRVLDGQLGGTGALTYASVHQALKDNMPRYGVLGSHEPQLLPAIADDRGGLAGNAFLERGRASEADTLPPVPVTRALKVRAADLPPALRVRLQALPGVVLDEAAPDLVLRGGGGFTLSNGRGDVVRTDADAGVLLARIEAEAAWRDALAAARGDAGLRAEIAPATRGGSFLDGETLRVDALLRTAAHVVVVNLDSGGRFSVLYPYLAQETRQLPAGQRRAIPGEAPEQLIVAGPPYGLDLVTVLAFREAPARLADWTDRSGQDLGSATVRQLAAALRQAGDGVQALTLELRTLAKTQGR